MNIETEVAQLKIRVERLEQQLAQVHLWSVDTEQDVEWDRESLANARRDIDFNSDKTERRLASLESKVAYMFEFMTLVQHALAESQQHRNFEALGVLEPPALPSGLKAESQSVHTVNSVNTR